MADDINTGELLLNRKSQSFVLTLIVVFALLAVLIFFYFFSFIPIEGESMENTIYDNQYCIVQRKCYNIERGDIVIVDVNTDKSKNSHDIVKRIIGISGDQLIFMHDENNNAIEAYICKKGSNHFVKLKESYIKESMTNENNFHNKNNDIKILPFTPELTSYNLDTLDPETYNTIIKCTVLIPNGHVFFMGDNRNVSRDSRYYGTRPLSKVKYKVLSVIY